MSPCPTSYKMFSLFRKTTSPKQNSTLSKYAQNYPNFPKMPLSNWLHLSNMISFASACHNFLTNKKPAMFCRSCWSWQRCSVTSSGVSSLCRFFTKVGGEQSLSVCGSKGKNALVFFCRQQICLISLTRLRMSVCSQAMRKIYKASLKYPEWKRKHNPTLKPWMFPEQNSLPCINASELTRQRADSLENIDESGLSEEKTQHSDDEET